MASKVFSIEGRSLKLDTAADIEPHLAVLRDMKEVEEIRLLGNTLGIEACKALGEVLATKKMLRVANFADIFTGRLLSEIPDALAYLLDSVVNHPHLHTVDLSDNAFGYNTHAPLVKFLAAHVPLQHLYLNNNGLGPHCSILVANSLSELYKNKEKARQAGKEVPDLETIVCGRNRLENGSMIAWTQAYALHNKVRTVRMIQNGIRLEGISYLISEGLSKASKLQCVDFQDNSFSANGARALSKTALHWPQLEELGVSDCYLTGKGSLLLTEALSKGNNKKLEVLRIQYNDMPAHGLKQLVDSAPEALPALRKVELNGNKFSEEDDLLVQFQELLEERKEEKAGDVVDEDAWGLDELDDLDDEDDGDEEDEDEELTPQEILEKLLVAAEEAQLEATWSSRKDTDVDALESQLSKTSIS